MKDGLGLYIWPEGNKYFGQWKNNVIDGEGIYIWSDGRVYSG